VSGVLAEIGADTIPQVMVYNKIDRLEIAPRVDRDADRRALAVWISAAKRAGLDLLQTIIAERLARVARQGRIRVPASAGALRSRLYAAGAVRGELVGEDGSLELQVELPDTELVALARTPGVEILEVREGDMPCAPGNPYLQSGPVLSATKLR
jgi:GTP-binding protein HflX